VPSNAVARQRRGARARARLGAAASPLIERAAALASTLVNFLSSIKVEINVPFGRSAASVCHFRLHLLKIFYIYADGRKETAGTEELRKAERRAGSLLYRLARHRAANRKLSKKSKTDDAKHRQVKSRLILRKGVLRVYWDPLFIRSREAQIARACTLPALDCRLILHRPMEDSWTT